MCDKTSTRKTRNAEKQDRPEKQEPVAGTAPDVTDGAQPGRSLCSTHERTRQVMRGGSLPVRLVILFTLFVACVYLLYQHLNEEPHASLATPPHVPQLAPAGPQPAPAPAVDMEEVFESSISPLLADARGEMDAAVGRALETMHEHFAGFHEGIAPFANDVTSWRARFQFAGRGISDLWDRWWNENPDAERLHQLVTEKLEAHVISEERIKQAVTAALTQFVEDLHAVRNRTLAGMHLALAASGIPVDIDLSSAGWARFKREVVQDMVQMSRHTGGRSIQNGILTIVAGETGFHLTYQLVRTFLVQFATLAPKALVPALAAGGGATVTAATAGGAGGSVAGPAGTVVGIGAGLVVGICIDWWCTAYFRAKLSGELAGYLDSVEHALVDGHDETPGLRQYFSGSAARFHELMSQTVKAQLLQ